MNNELGGDGPPEINPDIAIIQARQRGPSAGPGAGELPATAFVGSLNGLGGALTLQAGSLPSGIGVTYTQGANTISFNLTGIDPIATKKSNLMALVDPTAADDSSLGYAVGSMWINQSFLTVWICNDATIGAAAWIQLA